MEIKKVTQVHFSPSGTTRKTAEALSESFGLPVDDADLLHDSSVTRRFGADELVIFCLPVFAGRLPEFCPKMLSQFTGSDTDRKSTRLNSSHVSESRMPSSA